MVWLGVCFFCNLNFVSAKMGIFPFCVQLVCSVFVTS